MLQQYREPEVDLFEEVPPRSCRGSCAASAAQRAGARWMGQLASEELNNLSDSLSCSVGLHYL